MAAIPLNVRGLNVVLVVFSLLVLGGAAVAMNSAQLFSPRAGNVIQNAQGKLVKKGTPAFSPCKNVTTNFALIGGQTTSVIAKTSPSPTPACTPLSVQASLADPLVGKLVVATGTFTNGIFYATSLKPVTAQGTSNPKATCAPRPACLDSKPPCLPPEPVGGFCTK